METLRERDSSLLRAVTGHDSTAAETGQSSANRTQDENVSMNDTIRNVTPLPDSNNSDIHLQERFSAHYADPAFPQKTVPYAGLKRAFDIMLALVVLTLCAIPMAIV